MPFTDEQIAALSSDLDAKRVKKRPQGGRQIPYIETWDAIAKANEIFGFDGWDCQIIDLSFICEWQSKSRNGKPMFNASYRCHVRITARAGDQVVIHDGFGADSASGPNAGDAHENALKGAESDAIKRALVKFGWQFGLALYDEERKNVSDPDAGPSKSDLTAAYEMIWRDVSNAKTAADVRQIFTDNKPMLAAMKRATPDMYAKLKTHIDSTGLRLKEAEAAVPNGEPGDDVPF